MGVKVKIIKPFGDSVKKGVILPHYEKLAKERHKELSGTRSNPGEAVANLPQPAKEAKRSSEEVAKDILKDEALDQLKEKLQPNKISWTEDEYYDTYEKCISTSKKLSDGDDLYYLAHSKNLVTGKPQQIDECKHKIPFLREFFEVGKDEEVVRTFIDITKRFDRRKKGYFGKGVSEYHFVSRITESGIEYYCYSKEKLPLEYVNVKGMLIELEDVNELSKTLKLPSHCNLLLVKEWEPLIKVLDKEGLIRYSKELLKERGLTSKHVLDLQFYNPNGYVYNSVDEYKKLRIATILSGKILNMPLHICKLGPAGTLKTSGDLETLQAIFQEESGILDGGAGTFKGTIPSFAEKPAKLGHILNSQRVALIDELGKLLDKEYRKHQTVTNNLLGPWNTLLDGSERAFASGMDSVNVKATAQLYITTNPMAQTCYIQDLIGKIDISTMSRLFYWVQDSEECVFISKHGFQSLESYFMKNPPHMQNNKYIVEEGDDNNNNIYISLMVGGNIFLKGQENGWLTIIDSAKSFLCPISGEKVEELVDFTSCLINEPFKSKVWKPRARNHVTLLVDGLCKFRCIFEDFDSSFTPKTKDYDTAKAILKRMALALTTDLSPRNVVAEDASNLYTKGGNSE